MTDFSKQQQAAAALLDCFNTKGEAALDKAYVDAFHALSHVMCVRLTALNEERERADAIAEGDDPDDVNTLIANPVAWGILEYLMENHGYDRIIKRAQQLREEHAWELDEEEV